jgi:hypothetical protein
LETFGEQQEDQLVVLVVDGRVETIHNVCLENMGSVNVRKNSAFDPGSGTT